jgi:hypothetical protein
MLLTALISVDAHLFIAFKTNVNNILLTKLHFFHLAILFSLFPTQTNFFFHIYHCRLTHYIILDVGRTSAAR